MLTDKINEWCTAHGRTIEPGRRESIGYRDLAKALNAKPWDVRKALKAMRQQSPSTTEAEEHWLRRENRDLRRKVDNLLAERGTERQYENLITRAAQSPIEVPGWTLRPRGIDRHEVIPTVAAGDWHGDEVVRPAEVQYKNGYDRDIGTARMRTFFDNTVKVATSYFQGFRYPGIVLLGLGDQISGNIHEELRNNNADVVLSSVLYWVGPWVAGIRLLADTFGRVWVPWLVGNHGRMTQKPVYKRRVRDNFDWLLGSLIQRELASDSRVAFAIAEGAKLTYSLYNTRYIATHGDECRGGSGITGMITPLMIADARMRRTFEYDVWVLGHWHQLLTLPGIRANGSGKGWDEFAIGNNFAYQKPIQDFWLTDPRHKIIASMPIHVTADDEPWMRPTEQKAGPFRVDVAA